MAAVGSEAVWNPLLGFFQLLIVVIEEHFVLQDRPAYRSAEVVVTLLRFGTRRWCVEVASRIKGIVLHIIVGGAVKIDRSRS